MPFNTQYKTAMGGMFSYFDQELKQPGQWQLIRNAQVNEIGWIQQRYGMAQYGDIPSAHTVQGLYHLDSSNNAYDQTVMYSNGVGYYYVSGTWTSKETGLSTSQFFDFKVFTNLLFRTNITDGLKSWTGNTADAFGTTNAVSAPAAAHLEVFQERLYAAKTSANPSVVYYSSIPNLSNAITWDTTNDWFAVAPDDGQEITGMVQMGYWLYIFKTNSTYRWDGNQLYHFSDVGTSNSRSISASDQSIFFLRDTGIKQSRGIYLISGDGSRRISTPIQDYLDRVPEGQSTPAIFDGRHYLVYLGQTNGLDKVIADYDLFASQTFGYDVWQLHTVPDIVTYFAQIGGMIYVGSSDGAVLTFNDPSVYQDDGVDIAFELRTAQMSGVDRMNKSFWHGVWVQGERLSDVTFSLANDAANTDSLYGTAKYGIATYQAPSLFTAAITLDEQFTRKTVNKVGRSMQSRLYKATNTPPAIIKGIELEYSDYGRSY